MDQPGGVEARDVLKSLVGGRTESSSGHPDQERHDEHLRSPPPRRSSAFAHLRHGASEAIPMDIWRAGLFGSAQRSSRNIELADGSKWLRRGFLTYGPDEEYFDALEDARRNRRGIWSHEHNVQPWTFKRQKALTTRSPPVPNAPPLEELLSAARLWGNAGHSNRKIWRVPWVRRLPRECRFIRLLARSPATYNSTRITTRLADGRLTSRNPAAAKTLRAPTLISPQATSCPGAGQHRIALERPRPPLRAKSTAARASAALTPCRRKPARTKKQVTAQTPASALSSRRPAQGTR